MGMAWELFGQTEPGSARVQAICDWVHDNIQFQYGTSNPLTTAVDVLEQRRGVCRDLAHLAITFCRALNIPARYVFGYLPDIYVPPDPAPMDFAAWMEVYLGDRWWTFDPRNNARRVGRVLIGRGRDGIVDVFAPRVAAAIEFVAEVSVERRPAEPNRLADGWLADGYLLEASPLTQADDRILRAADYLSAVAEWGLPLADRINDWVYQSMTYRYEVTGVR